MAKYFEATNSTGTKAIIDDTYRYIYETETIQFLTSTKDFGTGSFDSGFVGGLRYWEVVKFTTLNQWHERTRGYKYFGNVVSKENSTLYGIRFKKASNQPKIWIRIFPSVLGAAIMNDPNQQSLLVEVFADSDISIDEALEYFEIVKIKNDLSSMPPCDVGAQIFDADGHEIWNSNCKMVSVSSIYKGVGGNWQDVFTTSNILIPAFGFKNTWNSRSDGYFGLTNHTQKDAYRFDGNNIYNDLLTISEKKGHRNEDGPGIWDLRDLGFCSGNDIGGIILNS